MLTFMDLVLRQFNQKTHWNEDNLYENVMLTSESLLEFEIPSSVNFNVAQQSTPHSFTSFNLSNDRMINGNITYLYTTCKDIVVSAPKLEDMVPSYRHIEPGILTRAPSAMVSRDSLYYGRMYFPGSLLEAMYIRRLTSTQQLVLKCVSSKQLKNDGTLTIYWQRDTGKQCNEIVFSTNEALLGLRTLRNLGSSALNTSFYKNSTLSLGADIWFGFLNMSPGCSTTLRYSTQSTNSGKPLTVTLSANPLLGHISSSYSVKTSDRSTCCTRYDFNIHSIESNLSFGCEYWKNSGVLKSSISLSDMKFKSLWQGKYGNMMVGTGVQLQPGRKMIEMTKFGINVQYVS